MSVECTLAESLWSTKDQLLKKPLDMLATNIMSDDNTRIYSASTLLDAQCQHGQQRKKKDKSFHHSKGTDCMSSLKMTVRRCCQKTGRSSRAVDSGTTTICRATTSGTTTTRLEEVPTSAVQKGDFGGRPGLDIAHTIRLSRTAEGDLPQNCFFPPAPPKPTVTPPNPGSYFRRRLFVWVPMRMWGIPLKCPTCDVKMNLSGIYHKVREVVDIESRSYLVGGEYLRCSQCKLPLCPWNKDIISQLDPSHRQVFPAILTAHLALDRKCVTLLKPRTEGNSSSYCQQKGSTLTWATGLQYEPPLPYTPVSLAQWFQTVHTNHILDHLEEHRGVITSTYGRILKIDSTKKVNHFISSHRRWTSATNNINHSTVTSSMALETKSRQTHHNLLESVSVARRYVPPELKRPWTPKKVKMTTWTARRRTAGSMKAGDIHYVDDTIFAMHGAEIQGVFSISVLHEHCTCHLSGVFLHCFVHGHAAVRLDIFHFMRRLVAGLTTEHHPLSGTFLSKLSSCVFE
eukprot:XP_011661965.1 PREDICTED: uncharacterized protein LOC105437258 [Strongylocentrotus purpuratus]